MPDQQVFAPHIQWLVEKRGPALVATLLEQGAGQDAGDAIAVLVAADPSAGGHAVQWLCDTLVGGGMRWEDVSDGATSKAAATLAGFAQARAGLPPGLRNLEDHTSLGSVHAAQAGTGLLEAARHEQTCPGSREQRRWARTDAYQHSHVLCQGPDLIVAVPCTVGASQWWGRGTQWCTSATHNNRFAHYHQAAPLIVVVLPGIHEGKLQLHMDGEDIQFMDIHDNNVDPGFVQEHWRALQPVMEWAMGINGGMLRYIEPRLCTPELGLAAVKSSGSSLRWLLTGQRSLEICMAAVANDPEALFWVPDEHICSQLFEAMVSHHPMSLATIPMPQRSRQVCLAAVAANGMALELVERRYHDAEFYLAAVQSCGRALAMVPQSLRTPYLCALAVQQDGSALAFVPTHMQTHALLRQAVQSNPMALRAMPPWLVDSGLCAMAVKSNPSALELVPHVLCTAEMCMQAVQSLPDSIRSVPPRLNTHELRMACVQANGSALEHMASYHRGIHTAQAAELRTAAVASNPRALRAVSGADMYTALCWQAVQADPGVFARVPYHLQTARMCSHAVAALGKNMLYARPDLLDQQMCNRACLDNPGNLEYVRPPYRDGAQEVVMQAGLVGVVGADHRPVHQDWDIACLDGLVGTLVGMRCVPARLDRVPGLAG